MVQMVIVLLHSMSQTCVVLVCLRIGHDLARWYYREFKGIDFKGAGQHGRQGP